MCVQDASAHVQHIRASSRYARRRLERTHGGVLNLHTEGFSACQAAHTHTNQHNTTPHHTPPTEDTQHNNTTTHNNTHNTTTHNTIQHHITCAQPCQHTHIHIHTYNTHTTQLNTTTHTTPHNTHCTHTTPQHTHYTHTHIHTTHDRKSLYLPFSGPDGRPARRHLAAPSSPQRRTLWPSDYLSSSSSHVLNLFVLVDSFHPACVTKFIISSRSSSRFNVSVSLLCIICHKGRGACLKWTRHVRGARQRKVPVSICSKWRLTWRPVAHTSRPRQRRTQDLREISPQWSSSLVRRERKLDVRLERLEKETLPAGRRRTRSQPPRRPRRQDQKS